MNAGDVLTQLFSEARDPALDPRPDFTGTRDANGDEWPDEALTSYDPHDPRPGAE